MKNPRKSILRAVFLSLGIVLPIYLLVAFVSLGAVSPDTPGMPTWQWLAEHAELGVAMAARQFMPLGTYILLLGGLLSTISALNATLFSSTRVSFAMGRDDNLRNPAPAGNGVRGADPATRPGSSRPLPSGVLLPALPGDPLPEPGV